MVYTGYRVDEVWGSLQQEGPNECGQTHYWYPHTPASCGGSTSPSPAADGKTDWLSPDPSPLKKDGYWKEVPSMVGECHTSYRYELVPPKCGGKGAGPEPDPVWFVKDTFTGSEYGEWVRNTEPESGSTICKKIYGHTFDEGRGQHRERPDGSIYHCTCQPTGPGGGVSVGCVSDWPAKPPVQFFVTENQPCDTLPHGCSYTVCTETLPPCDCQAAGGSTAGSPGYDAASDPCCAEYETYNYDFDKCDYVLGGTTVPAPPLLVDIFGLGHPDLLVPGAWRKNRVSWGPSSALRQIDMDGTGVKSWEWVGPSSGILLYGDTKPEQADGKNLFGTATFGKQWNNGYEPLATLDENRDGNLTGAELDKVWVWVDGNSDAKVEAKEVLPARSYLLSLAVRPTLDSQGDASLLDGGTLRNGKACKTWDWWSKPANPCRFEGMLGGSVKPLYPAVLEPKSGAAAPASVYFWKTDGPKPRHGFLRFFRSGGELYAVSFAGRLPNTQGYMFGTVARVESKGGVLSWRSFNPFTGGTSENLAAQTGEDLRGVLTYTGAGPAQTLTWSAIPVEGFDLPPPYLPLYAVLASVSPRDFVEMMQGNPDLMQGVALLFGGRDTSSGDIPFVSVGELK